MGISSTSSTTGSLDSGSTVSAVLSFSSRASRFDSLAACRFSARNCAFSTASCRRSARQLSKWTNALRTSRKGGPSHLPTAVTENVDIRYNDKMRDVAVSIAAPVRLSVASRDPEIRMPRIPPAENAPFHGCHAGSSARAVQMLSRSKPDPKILINGAWISADRTQRQANIHNKTGIENALSPKTWKNRSEVYEPAKPVRLCARAALEIVFQEESSGL